MTLISKTGKGHNKKTELHTNLFNKQLQNSSVKYWQIKFNSISKKSYAMVKLVSFQGCRDGSTYANH
jgi:hypothetical protein